jgi:hypothetical protein
MNMCDCRQIWMKANWSNRISIYTHFDPLNGQSYAWINTFHLINKNKTVQREREKKKKEHFQINQYISFLIKEKKKDLLIDDATHIKQYFSAYFLFKYCNIIKVHAFSSVNHYDEYVWWQPWRYPYSFIH